MSDLALAILPRNKTEFERAHLQAEFDAWPLDVDAIEREGNPDTCGVDKLPFISLDRGLTVWSDKWSEERRRGFVRDAWQYKVIEGSPAGIEAYLNLADCFVREEVLPPGRAFLIDDDGLDNAAVLSLMPQLRLYHHWPAREIPDGAVIGRNFVGETFLPRDEAALLGRYPVIWDQGVGTPLDVADTDITANSTVTLVRQGERGDAVYISQAFLGASLFGPPVSNDPVVYDRFDPRVETTRDPVDAFQEQAFVSRHVGDIFLTNDLGDIGTYDRVYLSAPDRLPKTTGLEIGAAYLGHSWLRFPPYHMLLTISMPGDLDAIPATWGFVGQGYPISPDRERTAFTMELADTARRTGDRVLFDLAPTSLGGYAPPLPSLEA